jgi:hypothetical protein
MICYLHDVECANETPYNPKEHTVCLLCSRKLEVMGDHGVTWANEAQGRLYAITHAVDFMPLRHSSAEATWANRLMVQNGYDREKAMANIPAWLPEEDREEVRLWLEVSCFGPQGSPLCECSFDDE